MSLSKKIYNEFKLMQSQNTQKRENMFGGAVTQTAENIIETTNKINYEKEIKRYKRKINKLKEKINKK
jgi:hypothetical protein